MVYCHLDVRFFAQEAMWTLSFLHDAICVWEPLLRGDDERAGTTALAATALQLRPHQRRSCMAPVGLEPTASSSVGRCLANWAEPRPLAHCVIHRLHVVLANPAKKTLMAGRLARVSRHAGP